MASQSDRWLISVDLDTTGIQRGLAGVNGMLNALTSGVGGPDGGGQAALPPATTLNALGSPQTVATSAIAASQGEMRDLIAAQGQVAALMQAQLAASSRVVGRQIQDLNRFGEVYFERLKNQIRGFNFFPQQQQAAIQQTFADAFQRKSQELMTSLNAIRLDDIATVFNRRLDREASLIAANAALSPVVTQRNVTGTIPLPADVRTYGRELERLMATNASLVRRHTGLLEQTNALQSGIIRSQQEVIAANRFAAQTTRDRVARSYNQVLAVNVGRPETPRAITPAPITAAITAPIRRNLPAPVVQQATIRERAPIVLPAAAPSLAQTRQQERRAAQMVIMVPSSGPGQNLVPTRNGFSSYVNNPGGLSTAERALIESLNTKSQALDRQTAVMTSNLARFTQAELGLINALERKAAQVNGLPAAGVPNAAYAPTGFSGGSRTPLALGAASPIVPPPYFQKQLQAGPQVLRANELFTGVGQRVVNPLTNRDLQRVQQILSLPGGSWDQFSTRRGSVNPSSFARYGIPLPYTDVTDDGLRNAMIVARAYDQSRRSNPSSLSGKPYSQQVVNSLPRTDFEAFRRVIADVAADYLTSGTPTVFTPATAVPSILADGRFKSQFETGASAGWYDPSMRSFVESTFGVPQFIRPNQRPVYGALEFAGGQRRLSDAGMYGDFGWMLRRGVLNRSSVSAGDSLDYNLRPVDYYKARNGLLLPEQIFAAFDPSVLDGVIDRFMRGKSFNGLNVSDHFGFYNELQIRGGARLSDVRGILGTGSLGSRNEDAAAELARRLGVDLYQKDIGLEYHRMPQAALPAGSADRFSTGGAKDFARTVIPFDLEGLAAELQLTRGLSGVNYYTNSGKPIIGFQNPQLAGRGLTKFNLTNRSANGLVLNDLLDEYLSLSGQLRQTDSGFSGYREEFEALFDRQGYGNRFSDFSRNLLSANNVRGVRLTRGQAVPILEDGSVGFGGLLGQSDRLYSYTTFPKVAAEYGNFDGFSRDSVRGRGSLGGLISVALPSAAIASFDLIGAQTPAFTGNYDPFDLNKLLGAEVLAPGLGRSALPANVLREVEQFVAVTDAWREAAGKLRRSTALGFNEFLALPAGTGDQFSSTASAQEAAFNRERQRYQSLREAGGRNAPPGYYFPADGGNQLQVFRTAAAQEFVNLLQARDLSTVGAVLSGPKIPFVGQETPFVTASGIPVGFGTKPELGGFTDRAGIAAKQRPAIVVLPSVTSPTGELGTIVAGITSQFSNNRDLRKVFQRDLSAPRVPWNEAIQDDSRFLNAGQLSFVPYRAITGFDAYGGARPVIDPRARNILPIGTGADRISRGTYSSLSRYPIFRDRFDLLNAGVAATRGALGPLSVEDVLALPRGSETRFSSRPVQSQTINRPDLFGIDADGRPFLRGSKATSDTVFGEGSSQSRRASVVGPYAPLLERLRQGNIYDMEIGAGANAKAYRFRAGDLDFVSRRPLLDTRTGTPDEIDISRAYADDLRGRVAGLSNLERYRGTVTGNTALETLAGVDRRGFPVTNYMEGFDLSRIQQSLAVDPRELLDLTSVAAQMALDGRVIDLHPGNGLYDLRRGAFNFVDHTSHIYSSPVRNAGQVRNAFDGLLDIASHTADQGRTPVLRDFFAGTNPSNLTDAMLPTLLARLGLDPSGLRTSRERIALPRGTTSKFSTGSPFDSVASFEDIIKLSQLGVLDVPRRLPNEAEFEYQSRVLNAVPPVVKHNVLSESRERTTTAGVLAEGATAYRQRLGLPEPQGVDWANVKHSLNKANLIADYIDATPRDPRNELYQRAYTEFKAQTESMWRLLTDELGIDVVKYDERPGPDGKPVPADPYPTAQAQVDDIVRNSRLAINRGEFFIGEADSPTGTNHPFMTADEYWRFRGVHDAFGHAAIGTGFDRHGEYAAWLQHSSMYRGLGARAMSSEYHGLNTYSWLRGQTIPYENMGVLLPNFLVENPFDREGRLALPSPVTGQEGYYSTANPRTPAEWAFKRAEEAKARRAAAERSTARTPAEAAFERARKERERRELNRGSQSRYSTSDLDWDTPIPGSFTSGLSVPPLPFELTAGGQPILRRRIPFYESFANLDVMYERPYGQDFETTPLYGPSRPFKVYDPSRRSGLHSTKYTPLGGDRQEMTFLAQALERVQAQLGGGPFIRALLGGELARGGPSNIIPQGQLSRLWGAAGFGGVPKPEDIAGFVETRRDLLPYSGAELYRGAGILASNLRDDPLGNINASTINKALFARHFTSWSTDRSLATDFTGFGDDQLTFLLTAEVPTRKIGSWDRYGNQRAQPFEFEATDTGVLVPGREVLVKTGGLELPAPVVQDIRDFVSNVRRFGSPSSPPKPLYSTSNVPSAGALGSVPESARQRLQAGLAYLDILTNGLVDQKVPGVVRFGDLPEGRLGVTRGESIPGRDQVILSPQTIGRTAEDLGVAGGRLSGSTATALHELVGHAMVGDSSNASSVFSRVFGLQFDGKDRIVDANTEIPSRQARDSVYEFIAETGVAVGAGTASPETVAAWDAAVTQLGRSELGSERLRLAAQGIEQIFNGASLREVLTQFGAELGALGVVLEGPTTSAAAATGAQAADTVATNAHTQAVLADAAALGVVKQAAAGGVGSLQALAGGRGVLPDNRAKALLPVIANAETFDDLLGAQGVGPKTVNRLRGAADQQLLRQQLLNAGFAAPIDSGTPRTATGGAGGQPPTTPPPIVGGPAGELPRRGGTGSGGQAPKSGPTKTPTDKTYQRIAHLANHPDTAGTGAAERMMLDYGIGPDDPKLRAANAAWQGGTYNKSNAGGAGGAGGGTGGPYTGPTGGPDPRSARERRRAATQSDLDARLAAQQEAQAARQAALSDPRYRRNAAATAAAARGVNRLDLTGLSAAQQKAIDSNILPFFGDGSDYRRSEAWRLAQSGSLSRAQQLRGQIREFALDRDADGNIRLRRRTRAEIGSAAERAAALQNLARGYGVSARDRARFSSGASNIISEFGLTPEDVQIIGQSQSTVRTQRTQSRLLSSADILRTNPLGITDIRPDGTARQSIYDTVSTRRFDADGNAIRYTAQQNAERIAALAERRAQSYGARSIGFIDDEWARLGFPLPQTGAAGGGRGGGRRGGGTGAGSNYSGFGQSGGNQGFFARVRQAVRGDAGIGGYFGQGLLSTVQYGLPAMLMYGGFSAISNSLREAEELKYNLARLESQLQATFGEQAAGKVDAVKNSIIQLAKETGIGADVLADMEIKIRGAFEGETIDGLSGEALVQRQREAAARIAAVTKLDPKEVNDGLIAASLAFDATEYRLGDIATGLEARTGVPAAELIAFLGDVAPTAADAGFTAEEISAYAAVTLQRSGRSGASLAEAFNRVLPAVSAAAPQITELVSLTPALQTPEMIDAIRTGDVATQIRELSENFGQLDKKTQDFVINLLGGRREAQAIISAFNNADQVKELFDVANNSAGELDSRFEKLRNTLTNTLARLGEQFRALTNAILDAGLADAFALILTSVSGILSVVSPLLNTIAGLNEAFGGWPARLAAAYGFFKLFQFTGNRFGPEIRAAFGGASIGDFGRRTPKPIGVDALGNPTFNNLRDQRLYYQRTRPDLGGFISGPTLGERASSRFSTARTAVGGFVGRRTERLRDAIRSGVDAADFQRDYATYAGQSVGAFAYGRETIRQSIRSYQPRPGGFIDQYRQLTNPQPINFQQRGSGMVGAGALAMQAAGLTPRQPEGISPARAVGRIAAGGALSSVAGIRAAGGSALTWLGNNPFLAFTALATIYGVVNQKMSEADEGMRELIGKTREGNAKAIKAFNEGDVGALSRRADEIRSLARDSRASQSLPNSLSTYLTGSLSEADILEAQAVFAEIDPGIIDRATTLAGNQQASSRSGRLTFGSGAQLGSSSDAVDAYRKDREDALRSIGRWQSRNLAESNNSILNFFAGEWDDAFFGQSTVDYGGNPVAERVLELANVEGGFSVDVMKAALSSNPQQELLALRDSVDSDSNDAQAINNLLTALDQTSQDTPSIYDALAKDEEKNLSATELMTKKISELSALRQAGVLSLEEYVRRGNERISGARRSLFGGANTRPSEENFATFYNEQREFNAAVAQEKQKLANQRVEELQVFSSNQKLIAQETAKVNADLLRDQSFNDPDARRSAALTLLEATKSFYIELLASAKDQAEANKILAQLGEDPNFNLAMNELMRNRITTSGNYQTNANFYQEVRSSGRYDALDRNVGPSGLLDLVLADIQANGGQAFSGDMQNYLLEQMASVNEEYNRLTADGQKIGEGDLQNLGGSLAFLFGAGALGGLNVNSPEVAGLGLDPALVAAAVSGQGVIPDAQLPGGTPANSFKDGDKRTRNGVTYEYNAKNNTWYARKGYEYDVETGRSNAPGRLPGDAFDTDAEAVANDPLVNRYRQPGNNAFEFMSPEAIATYQEEQKRLADEYVGTVEYEGARRRIGASQGLKYAQREFEGASDTELAQINVDTAAQVMDAAEKAFGKDSEQYQQARAEWYKSKTALVESMKADAMADGELAASYARLRKDSVGAARAQREAAEAALAAGSQDPNSAEYKQNKAAVNDAIGAEIDAQKQRNLRPYDVLAAQSSQGGLNQALIALARAQVQRGQSIGDDIFDADIALAEAERAVRQAQDARVQSLYRLAQARADSGYEAASLGVGAAMEGVGAAAREYGTDSAEFFDAYATLEEQLKALRAAYASIVNKLFGLQKSRTNDNLANANYDVQAAQQILDEAKKGGNFEEIVDAETALNEAVKAERAAYRARVEALYGLLNARTRDPLQQSDNNITMLNQLLADAKKANDIDAIIDIETRLIEAQRTAADAMQDVRISAMELRQAELAAMEDDVGAAQVARQQAQAALQYGIDQGVGEAEINRLRAQAISADKAAQDAVYNDRYDEYKYMLEMNEISKSTYMAHIRNLQSTVIPGSKKFKELELELKRLKDDMSADLSINMPSSLGLPTIYEIRRMNQQTSYNAGGAPMGYTDARTLNISGVSINSGMDFQQFVQVMAQFMGIPGTSGAAPRHY